MPRWEKAKKFTTLVVRKENLLVTNGSIGKEGKSEILRFMSGAEAEAENAARVAKLEEGGWKRVDFTIDPNAKPARGVIQASDAARQLENLFHKADFVEAPTLAEGAELLKEFGKLTFSAERTWRFFTENDPDNKRVLVTIECRFGGENVAQLLLVFPDEDEELDEASVERTGGVGSFLERASATKTWRALAKRTAKDAGVEGY